MEEEKKGRSLLLKLQVGATEIKRKMFIMTLLGQLLTLVERLMVYQMVNI